METTYNNYLGIKNDTVITNKELSSNYTKMEVGAPSFLELGMLGFVVVLFFIPFIWYVSHSALLSIY